MVSSVLYWDAGEMTRCSPVAVLSDKSGNSGCDSGGGEPVELIEVLLASSPVPEWLVDAEAQKTTARAVVGKDLGNK